MALNTNRQKFSTPNFFIFRKVMQKPSSISLRLPSFMQNGPHRCYITGLFVCATNEWPHVYLGLYLHCFSCYEEDHCSKRKLIWFHFFALKLCEFSPWFRRKSKKLVKIDMRIFLRSWLMEPILHQHPQIFSEHLLPCMTWPFPGAKIKKIISWERPF